ncbi:MAG: PDZ domain-containing protein [Planctomycetota bacterium]|jgi:hypothetical protein
MKKCTRTVSIVTLLAMGCMLAGCSSSTMQRGWIGGHFKQARQNGTLLGSPPDPSTIRALPADIAKMQKGAIFVAGVYPNTPLAQAGLEAGDLIVSVNETPVASLKSFRAVIDKAEPGASVRLSVYRQGMFNDHTVVVGKETLDAEYPRSLAIGLFLEMRADLWPNPDFNILGLLGYRQWDHRMDLQSPEGRAISQGQSRRNAGPSRGWLLCLGLVRLSFEHLVVEQQGLSDYAVNIEYQGH